MILTKEQYDKMIDEDPFPFYKYDRLSEEEKILSCLTVNSSEHENLTCAIANFGPQPFRGTYGTNFQPPGFERNIRWCNDYTYPPGQGPAPPSGLLPPGLHPSAQHSLGQSPSVLNPHALAFSSVPDPSVMPRLDHSLPGPSSLVTPRPRSIQTKDSPQLKEAASQSFRCDITAKPEYKELPVPEYTWPKIPAHCLLIVDGDSSGEENVEEEGEEEEEEGKEEDHHDEIRRLRQPELERIRSKSSDSSHESIEMTSGRVSLTSSRTTPPKA